MATAVVIYEVVVDVDIDVEVVDEEIEDNELMDDFVVVVGSNNSLAVALSFFAERSKYHTGGQELSVPLISVGS